VLAAFRVETITAVRIAAFSNGRIPDGRIKMCPDLLMPEDASPGVA